MGWRHLPVIHEGIFAIVFTLKIPWLLLGPHRLTAAALQISMVVQGRQVRDRVILGQVFWLVLIACHGLLFVLPLDVIIEISLLLLQLLYFSIQLTRMISLILLIRLMGIEFIIWIMVAI
jgi:hypothetical protein